MARSMLAFIPAALALFGCGSELNRGTSKPLCADCGGGPAPAPSPTSTADGDGSSSPVPPEGVPAPTGILPAGPWKEAAAGMDGSRITSLAYDPGNAKIVYAASYGAGVFKSTDGAATWAPSSMGLGEHLCVVGVYVHPAVSSIVFATAQACEQEPGYNTATFELFRSTNAGATWTKVTPPDRLEPRAKVPVFASRADASIVYAYSENQLWRSSDGGATFSPRNVLPSTRHFFGAVADPTQADVVFASVDVGWSTPGRTVRSPDGGVTWTDVTLPASRQATRLWMAQDRTVWATLINNVSSELWSSASDGATWEMRSGPKPCVSDSIALAPNATRIYSVGGGVSVCRSNDLGAFVPATTLPLLAASDIAVSPAAADEWLVATTDELLRSADAGATVAESQTGITNRDVHALAIAPANGQVLYAGARGRIFRSSDGAKTWKRLGSGLPSGFYVTSLAVHPTNANIVYAGVWGREISDVGYVYKSVNGGVTFQRVLGDPLHSIGRATSIIVNAANPSHVSVLAGQHFISTNDGLTWGNISEGNTVRGHLVGHPTEPSIVGLIQNDAESPWLDVPAYRSNDGGLTFSPWSLPAKTFDIAFDADVASKLYACTDEGPKVSIDNGLTWSPALVGLVSQDSSSLACRRFFQTRKGGQLYMNDHQGAIWVTKDGAATWTRTKGIATLPGGPALATFHQHRITTAVVDGEFPDTVFIGLRGSVGVVKSTTAGL